MNSADRTKERLESLKATISNQLYFYENLLKSMSDTGFPAYDPLLLAALTAPAEKPCSARESSSVLRFGKSSQPLHGRVIL